ncbi:unnamed protein product (macronuclear) [Paramecium tetraurelia]|uniref:TNFR-Cys domain-containing protein n=1 Tax=Paramecium tetraurelia TaxID=5888 RepID=A0DX81_PARTE|nr:uncharacterized protein GSPATT00021280001 [Paramecium tetraurelia]CAK87648.1 unnamed protein product [Paramecium tetraurelia]|eukprot:XP_001455045.1 hypothetical protein (macronuclear) [Paramecium tetraurelia strain d4-2]
MFKQFSNVYKIIDCSNCTCPEQQYYDSIDLICKDCDPICTLCNGVANNCQSCSPTHYLNGSTCTKCTAPCLDCSDIATCQSCVLGYYLDGTDCFKCDLPCVNCSTQGNTDCQSCQNGYYLNDLICEQCDLNCTLCDISPANCSDCQIGLLFRQYNLQRLLSSLQLM